MKRAIIVLAFYLLTASGALAAGPSPSQTAASDFVQRFYNWYAPMARKAGPLPSWIVALDKRGAQFDPRLSRALREDAEAQERSPDDIVGLDFDPFLNGQDDPADKYATGDVTESEGASLVSVYGVRNGKRAATPDVVAELKPAKNSFQFTNFRYGADGDLLGILKLLSDQRAHPAE